MTKNFISDIIDSADRVVMSTGDAVDKIISISNSLAKRKNESSEDYQIGLEHLERKKEINLQFKLDQQKAKKQAQLERTKVKAELQREQRQIKLEQQQLKQEAKKVCATERTEEREVRRQAKFKRQQLKQEAKLQLIK